MAGRKKSNPLSPSMSNEELAEEFATFFIKKSGKSGMHLILVLSLGTLNIVTASPLQILPS